MHRDSTLHWYGTMARVERRSMDAGLVRTLGLMLNGQTLNVTDDLGNPIVDDSFLILLNAHHGTVEFLLPPRPAGRPHGMPS